MAARQEIVLQALKKLATRRLTGPKIVELCHCVGETQEPELANFMAHSLPPAAALHNFLLTYADMASLTNISWGTGMAPSTWILRAALSSPAALKPWQVRAGRESQVRVRTGDLWGGLQGHPWERTGLLWGVEASQSGRLC